MPDRFSQNAASLLAPATHGFSIVPSDSADLAETTRAVYCGVGGDVVATLQSGATVLFTNVTAGALLPIRLTKVAATGTTATGLVGLV